MTEPNTWFEEIFALANGDYVGAITADADDDGTAFPQALASLFEQSMTNLAERMPEDDEESANQMMADEVQRLMTLCFKSGMIYQHEVEASEPDPEVETGAIPVMISTEQAAQLVMGMVAGGAAFRLVVDRGQD